MYSSEPKPNGFEVLNSRLTIDSPESLTNLLDEAKKNSYEDFKNNIQSHEKNGFKSLMPTFNSDADEDKIMEYQAFKMSDSEKFHTSNNLKVNLDEGESNLEDDLLIADPYFALVLNRNREIQVGDNIYKFTDKGLFFTKSSNYQNLIKIAERIEPVEPCESHMTGEIIKLEDNVNYFKPTPDPCGGIPSPPPPPYTPPAPPKPLPTKEEIRDNLKICNYHSTWLDDIFGPSQDCTDYFESDKRIRVKTWAQNYLIFASVGVKVESQNRFMGIWWAEDINEVEVGYSLASFEYDGVDMEWPSSTVDFNYEYGDNVIDQYGRHVEFANNAPRSFFESFPIEDEDKALIKIYLYRSLPEILNLPSNYLTLTGDDFNEGVQDIVEDAVKTLKSTLNKEINGNSAVLVYPSTDHSKLYFLYTNWRQTETNDNRISETFDWNTAVIGFSSKGGEFDKPIYDKPRSYKNFQIVCYGMGKRGSTWKGARISLEDSQ